MPVLGYILGGAFADIIDVLGKYLVLAIFCAIGGKMLQEAFMKEDHEKTPAALTHKLLLIQAVATSIDAFAIGVGFSTGNVEIFSAVSIIAVTTFLLSLVAVEAGRAFGNMLGGKAETFGGVLLIILGLKAFL